MYRFFTNPDPNPIEPEPNYLIWMRLILTNQKNRDPIRQNQFGYKVSIPSIFKSKNWLEPEPKNTLANQKNRDPVRQNQFGYKVGIPTD